jgi:hypothetical protein
MSFENRKIDIYRRLLMEGNREAVLHRLFCEALKMSLACSKDGLMRRIHYIFQVQQLLSQ